MPSHGINCEVIWPDDLQIVVSLLAGDPRPLRTAAREVLKQLLTILSAVPRAGQLALHLFERDTRLATVCGFGVLENARKARIFDQFRKTRKIILGNHYKPFSF